MAQDSPYPFWDKGAVHVKFDAVANKWQVNISSGNGLAPSGN